nr:hypothetical protein GCM10025732_26160 [Glycomyces mayteni]
MRFAGVDAAGGDGPVGGGAPAVAGGDDFGGAVVVFEVELRGEGRVLAVEGAGLAVEAEALGVPASGEVGADGVGSFAEEIGDVVGLVDEA